MGFCCFLRLSLSRSSPIGGWELKTNDWVLSASRRRRNKRDFLLAFARAETTLKVTAIISIEHCWKSPTGDHWRSESTIGSDRCARGWLWGLTTGSQGLEEMGDTLVRWLVRQPTFIQSLMTVKRNSVPSLASSATFWQDTVWNSVLRSPGSVATPNTDAIQFPCGSNFFNYLGVKWQPTWRISTRSSCEAAWSSSNADNTRRACWTLSVSRGVYLYLPLATNAPRTIWGILLKV